MPSRGSRQSVSVEVDVWLDDFDDEILIEELEERGYKVDVEVDENDFNRAEIIYLLEMLEGLPYSPMTRNIIDKLKVL